MLHLFLLGIAMLYFVGVKMQIRKCVETDIIPLGRFYDEEVKWLDDNDCNYPLWIYKG